MIGFRQQVEGGPAKGIFKDRLPIPAVIAGSVRVAADKLVPQRRIRVIAHPDIHGHCEPPAAAFEGAPAITCAPRDKEGCCQMPKRRPRTVSIKPTSAATLASMK